MLLFIMNVDIVLAPVKMFVVPNSDPAISADRWTRGVGLSGPTPRPYLPRNQPKGRLPLSKALPIMQPAEA
ncbi:hypothetical protein GCM10022278_29620 [Allohahella marinimesophila]|uniref:Uncharacterized protein n=1 Tax=Allohahella marinimesophila TaxID=1054972 RepID=A0ABP7PRG2_9GAMM